MTQCAWGQDLVRRHVFKNLKPKIWIGVNFFSVYHILLLVLKDFLTLGHNISNKMEKTQGLNV